MKDVILFLDHILDSISNINKFLKGCSKNDVINNIEKQSAVIRQIEIIGEATKNLPPDFVEKYKAVPWSNIIGMRNKLIHHYFGVDFETVWKAVKKDLPKLKKEIMKIKKELQ